MVPRRKTVRPERKATVSFSRNVRVRLTTSLSEYSSEEKHDCWYTADEMSTIKDDIRRTLKHMKHNNKTTMTMTMMDDDIRFTRRGLEAITGNGKRRKMYLRRLACDAVLDEQDACHRDAHHHLGNDDGDDPIIIIDKEQSIADRYMAYCIRTRELAHEIGLADAAVVRAYNYYHAYLQAYEKQTMQQEPPVGKKKKPEKPRSFRSLLFERGQHNNAALPAPASDTSCTATVMNSPALQVVSTTTTSSSSKIIMPPPPSDDPSSLSSSPRSTLDHGPFLLVPVKLLSPAAA